MSTKPKPITTGVIVAAIVGSLIYTATSCAKATEPFKDADRSSVVNSAPMDVIQMSDGFSNVGTKCDHGNRLYVAFKGDDNRAAIAVVPNDPTCASTK